MDRDGGAKNLSPLRRRLEALLPAEVAVEDDLVFDAAGLRGAFALNAQVDPLTELNAPAQTDTAAVRPGHRQAAVGRQHARPLVRHQPVADVELHLRRGQARLGVGFAACAQYVRATP